MCSAPCWSRASSPTRAAPGNYGAGSVSDLLGSNFAGFVVEGLGAFLIVLVICSVAFNERARQEWAPLAIGLTFAFAVMIFGPLTGANFNPARWFGPALIGDALHGKDLIPFVLGPIVGGLIAVGLYKFVIAGPAVRAGPGAGDDDASRRRPGGQGRRAFAPGKKKYALQQSAVQPVTAPDGVRSAGRFASVIS